MVAGIFIWKLYMNNILAVYQLSSRMGYHRNLLCSMHKKEEGVYRKRIDLDKESEYPSIRVYKESVGSNITKFKLEIEYE